jgi:hypothetical protein
MMTLQGKFVIVCSFAITPHNEEFKLMICDLIDPEQRLNLLSYLKKNKKGVTCANRHTREGSKKKDGFAVFCDDFRYSVCDCAC